MASLYDPNAPKTEVQVHLNSDLVAKAETSKVDLSSVLERALGDELMAVETRAWSAENALAIKAYNKFVDEIGCFGEEFREF